MKARADAGSAMTGHLTGEQILAEARRALEIEIAGLRGLLPRLGAEFERAARTIYQCRGKVAVTGVGKSGHIGRKIASTLASTGTPSFFIHPAEAIHGDLGMVSAGDVVLALSNSGETEEVIRLLAPFRRLGLTVIAMTGNPASQLAKRAEVHLDVSVAQEACPLGLAPTASTTATLAMGDALAVCLLRMRNFREEDYKVFHPGGSLGKKIVTTVGDLMDRGDKLPRVLERTTVREAIPELQEKHYGITAVVDRSDLLRGVFTMGDLTRLHLRDPSLGFMERPIAEFMTRSPRTIAPDALAAMALHEMETHNIRALVVTEADGRAVGVIGLYETLRAIDY